MKTRIPFLFFLPLLLVVTSLPAQERKVIAVEDIWAKPLFWPRMIPGFNWFDDSHYTSVAEGKIVKSDVLTGAQAEVLFDNPDHIEFDDYFFSGDKSRIYLSSETEEIYRHSFKAIYYVYDLKEKKLRKISPDKIAYVTPSPDGEMVAYTRDNNLYYSTLKDLTPVPVTTDGKTNEIINGSTDWVYEEEFSFTRAFFWSPDSKKIAFLRFDESEVKEYTMQLWNELYPVNYRFKYPKAGEKNSTVTVHCYQIENNSLKKIYEYPGDGYIPRLMWTRDPDIISIQTLNRHQNDFKILHASVRNGTVTPVYEEKNNSYVEITDDLAYLKDGKHFILTSEKDGFKHIYKFDMNGSPAGQLTRGGWETDKLWIDEKNDKIYYTSTEVSPLERHLYSVNMGGKQKKRLTQKSGTHDVDFNPGFTYFMDTYSSLNTPPVFSLQEVKSGKEIKVYEDNRRLQKTMEEYKLSPATFFHFTTPDNVLLNGFMIKPMQMDPQKKYPVLVFVYGGPGYQSVKDTWQGPNYFWFQMLAQQGYVVVSVDNRGTGGRGANFKKITQNQLGKYETEDIIHTAKYLGALPFIDKERIGIFGWSFGGYLASLAMTLGAEYYKTGIAVAPVTNWRFYDTIYTERYLGLPQENSEGYDKYSPVTYADKLKGNYLLVHGTADDNVHVQNSLVMADALVRSNKQFDVFYYTDRNHGIYGGNTRLHLYNMMTDFILKKL